ncbi:MAG: holin family protein [Pontixanthobacter sp.]
MPLIESLIGPIASLIDKIIPDKDARAKAKLELIRLEGSHELAAVQARLSAIVAEAQSKDPWTSRARPSFLYVMYILLLAALPMGILAAFSPVTARDIAQGMNAYLAGLPEPLYALFGTGYLGYTAARQWGKVKGVDG